MKIGYFADGPWAHKAIELLANDPDIKIAFIVPRFDKQDPVLKDWAKQLRIPFLVCENVNKNSFLKQVSEFNCDLFVSMSFNQIIRNPLLEVPSLGFINCHAGALPFYRGRNPLNWALINGEKEFGITVHYIDEGIDTGDIIEQKMLPISQDDTYGTLLETAINNCGHVLFKAIKNLFNDQVRRIPQKTIHPVGTYFCQRKPGDEFIRFDWTSERVFNFVRALAYPGPLAKFRYGGVIYDIHSAKLIEDAPEYICIEGIVTNVNGSIITVKTLDSTIQLNVSASTKSSPSTLKVGARLDF